jgi:hypothetical protein
MGRGSLVVTIHQEIMANIIILTVTRIENIKVEAIIITRLDRKLKINVPSM